MNQKLKKLEKQELYSLLLELATMNKENQDFLRLKLQNNPKDAVSYYKKKIKDILWNEKVNLKEARKAISDFKRISKKPEYLLELMTFYVETGVEMGEEYGDMYETFYSGMESMFEQIVKILDNNQNLIPNFKSRLNSIIERSCEGWAHRETLLEIYEGLKYAKIQ